MQKSRIFSCLILLSMLMFGCTKTIRQGNPMTDFKAAAGLSEGQEVLAQCDHYIGKAKGTLQSIVDFKGPRNVQNTLEPLNNISILMDSASSKASLFFRVHPNESVRNAGETCIQRASEFGTDLDLNRNLFDAVSAVDVSQEDAETKRFHEKTLSDFKRSGVHLDEKGRASVKKLKEELVKVGQSFGKNIREDVRSVSLESKLLDGLPADYIERHPTDKYGKVTVTTDYPDYVPFMKYAKSGEARKQLYLKFTNRGYPKNEVVLKKLIELRFKLAQTLGFSNYADYVLANKMIKTPSNAASFISKIANFSKERADADMKALLELKKKTEPAAKQINHYDRGYYENILKKEKYAVDPAKVREFLPFESVLDGVLALTSDMFDIQYVENLEEKTWHSSVLVYDVFEGKKPLGQIYLDLHPRDGKYKHAMQATIQGGIKGLRLPKGALVCNFPDPSEGPALMEHGDLTTLLHEFGHLLHEVLGGHQKWHRFTGVATEWDFVEAPSQLLEEWAFDHDVLSRFAKHFETGKTIGAEMVQNMRNAEEFGKGADVRHQMFYAALSLNYYNTSPDKLDLLGRLKELQKIYSPVGYVEGSHFYTSFGHLDGYSAMYYTYMWSKVIQKDLFSAFEKAGLMNKEVALKYRKTILEPGGTADAADLVRNFLGRDYSFDSYKTWLDG